MGTTRLYGQNTVEACITKKHIRTLRNENLEFESRDVNMASTEVSNLFVMARTEAKSSVSQYSQDSEMTRFVLSRYCCDTNQVHYCVIALDKQTSII